MQKFEINKISYNIGCKGSFAFVSDIHKNAYAPIFETLKTINPTAIFLVGDIAEDNAFYQENAEVYSFLSSCAKLTKTFYSFGNHELGAYHHINLFAHPPITELPSEIIEKIEQTGVELLNNTFTKWNGICIGGLSSKMGKESEISPFLETFSKEQGRHLLLCHHPEYYKKYIRKTPIELTLSGHAHGGHWRIFGQGIYAPGQGFFPKYTSGFYENRLLVSRGIGDQTKIPRLLNKRELILIESEK